MSQPVKPNWWSSDEWVTPPEIVRTLEVEFGPFELDACARPENAKAPQFYVKTDDGLSLPWKGRTWLNPPYSNPGPWLRKAVAEVSGVGGCPLVVALLPSCTETRWFQEFVLGCASDVRFRKGRIGFHGWEGTPIPSPKRGSVFAIYEAGFIAAYARAVRCGGRGGAADGRAGRYYRWCGCTP